MIKDNVIARAIIVREEIFFAEMRMYARMIKRNSVGKTNEQV